MKKTYINIVKHQENNYLLFRNLIEVRINKIPATRTNQSLKLKRNSGIEKKLIFKLTK
jgi:hypothetical protein